MRDIQNVKGSIKGPNEKACAPLHSAGHVEWICEQEPAAAAEEKNGNFLAAREPWDLFIQDWSDILTLKHLCNIFASGKGAIALSFSKWQRGLGCIALCFRNAFVTHRVFMSVCLQLCLVNTVSKHYRKYKFDLNVLFLNTKCFKIKSVNRSHHY